MRMFHVEQLGCWDEWGFMHVCMFGNGNGLSRGVSGNGVPLHGDGIAHEVNVGEWEWDRLKAGLRTGNVPRGTLGLWC